VKKDLAIFAVLLAVFLTAYFLDLSAISLPGPLMEACSMLQWYARNHTLACVVPAMFIAGAIAAFLSKEAVLRHLGPKANKAEAYSVASVSGTVLAVCSCSVLPMFAGIYRVGAGLGPASAFLYSGPAINVMALFLTARVLGIKLGLARAAGAVVFAVVIGVLMELIFRKDEEARNAAAMKLPEPPPARRALWQTALYFACMIGFLVFSDWSDPSETLVRVRGNAQATLMDGKVVTLDPKVPLDVAVLMETTRTYRFQLEAPAGGLKKGVKFMLAKQDIAERKQLTPPGYELTAGIYNYRWYLAGACGLAVALMLLGWFDRGELTEWLGQTWGFAKTIIPLLFGGVFATGFVAALLPESYVGGLVGGNSLQANFVASLVGAMWYFATLTEIPILEALTGLGMGQGPALALLLAGPALSLPSIAVIYKVIGLKKTAVFVALVVVLSTLVGMFYGAFIV